MYHLLYFFLEKLGQQTHENGNATLYPWLDEEEDLKVMQAVRDQTRHDEGDKEDDRHGCDSLRLLGAQPPVVTDLNVDVQAAVVLTGLGKLPVQGSGSNHGDGEDEDRQHEVDVSSVGVVGMELEA